MKAEVPIFVLGPTGIGKSALALRLAKEAGAEVVCMDAFQVYRGLNIGTGKPSEEERRQVRHHLVDFVDPLSAFTVADYLKEAVRVRDDLIARGKASVWVGGTGLYYRCLRTGLTGAPGSNPRVVEELSKEPYEKLVEEVRACDPIWAEGADLKNPRRVIRALAVYRETGKPLSKWQSEPGDPVWRDGRVVCLSAPLEVVRERIGIRVEKMWREGWPEEVRSLSGLEGWQGTQSAMALGYAEVLDFVEGRLTEEECLRRITLKTGQFAKRQLTWFRREPDLRWVDLEATETISEIEIFKPE